MKYQGGKDMRDLLEELERRKAAGDRAVLATVVATTGSAYRKPGARMLLSEAGTVLGSVSGGCLEGDLLDIARTSVLPSGRPRLVLYDTRADEDLVWGLNMGCNGVIEVLLSPMPADDPVQQALRSELNQGRPCTLVTRLGNCDGYGTCLVRAGGELEGSFGDPRVDAAVLADALLLLERAGCAALVYEPGRPRPEPGGLIGRPSPPGEEVNSGAVRLFIEAVQPPPSLCLFGAGHDATPLAESAARAGWAITVVDHRPAFLTPERFPRAVRLVQADASDAARAAGVHSESYCVVMTHHYGHDRTLLRSLLDLVPRHIGILGPRSRTESLLRDLHAEGYAPSPEALEVLASPLGLDIGGESPEEIAVSALAELQAVRYARNGGRLRSRPEPIHHERGAPDRPGRPRPGSGGPG
jgi:xanthine dehydrogenase accessory factor